MAFLFTRSVRGMVCVLVDHDGDRPPLPSVAAADRALDAVRAARSGVVVSVQLVAGFRAAHGDLARVPTATGLERIRSFLEVTQDRRVNLLLQSPRMDRSVV